MPLRTTIPMTVPRATRDRIPIGRLRMPLFNITVVVTRGSLVTSIASNPPQDRAFEQFVEQCGGG